MKVDGPFRLVFAGFLLASVTALGAQSNGPHGIDPGMRTMHLDDASSDAVVGRYRNVEEPDVYVVVYRDGGTLYEESERSPRQELVEKTRDHYATVTDSVSFVFTRNAGGAVDGFTQ